MKLIRTTPQQKAKMNKSTANLFLVIDAKLRVILLLCLFEIVTAICCGCKREVEIAVPSNPVEPSQTEADYIYSQSDAATLMRFLQTDDPTQRNDELRNIFESQLIALPDLPTPPFRIERNEKAWFTPSKNKWGPVLVDRRHQVYCYWKKKSDSFVLHLNGKDIEEIFPAIFHVKNGNIPSEFSGNPHDRNLAQFVPFFTPDSPDNGYGDRLFSFLPAFSLDGKTVAVICDIREGDKGKRSPCVAARLFDLNGRELHKIEMVNSDHVKNSRFARNAERNEWFTPVNGFGANSSLTQFYWWSCGSHVETFSGSYTLHSKSINETRPIAYKNVWEHYSAFKKVRGIKNESHGLLKRVWFTNDGNLMLEVVAESSLDMIQAGQDPPKRKCYLVNYDELQTGKSSIDDFGSRFLLDDPKRPGSYIYPRREASPSSSNVRLRLVWGDKQSGAYPEFLGAEAFCDGKTLAWAAKDGDLVKVGTLSESGERTLPIEFTAFSNFVLPLVKNLSDSQEKVLFLASENADQWNGKYSLYDLEGNRIHDLLPIKTDDFDFLSDRLMSQLAGLFVVSTKEASGFGISRKTNQNVLASCPDGSMSIFFEQISNREGHEKENGRVTALVALPKPEPIRLDSTVKATLKDRIIYQRQVDGKYFATSLKIDPVLYREKWPSFWYEYQLVEQDEYKRKLASFDGFVCWAQDIAISEVDDDEVYFRNEDIEPVRWSKEAFEVSVIKNKSEWVRARFEVKWNRQYSPAKQGQ